MEWEGDDNDILSNTVPVSSRNNRLKLIKRTSISSVSIKWLIEAIFLIGRLF